MKQPTFVVVGSGGGGATIAWLLAKAGHSVTLLEQGPDLAETEFMDAAHKDDPEGFNRHPHNEYFYRVRRPDPKRRLRGEYNTFRRHAAEKARPFKNGWTGSVLGGGSVLWGTWAFRALPVDFKLATVFRELQMSKDLADWGYAVADWPVKYTEMEPFYNVAEALLAVSGDRAGWVSGIKASPWYQQFSQSAWFTTNFPAKSWEDAMNFPCPPYPRTPVGRVVSHGMAQAGLSPLSLPTAIVRPGTAPYSTREKLAAAIAELQPQGDIWQKPASELWSERVRLACNLCGFCGEYLCWGGARAINGHELIPGAPKSGTHSTVIQELRDMRAAGADVGIVCNAKVYEVIHDDKTRRATSVRYLDVTRPDKPKPRTQEGEFVILSGGAVQTARLLWMSGPSWGLGNRHDQLGRHAAFHLFGLGAKATFKQSYLDAANQKQVLHGLLHGEFGHTGNVTSFAPYFVKDANSARWFNAGTFTSTAKKNPLENAFEKTERVLGKDLLKELDLYERSFEVRLTADDLPMPTNRVDLDPAHVDEYGFPVARITRDVGMHEWLMYEQVKPQLERIFKPYVDGGMLEKPPGVTPHIADLIGDRQMGTCRMGDDPKTSVVNRWCRLHESENLFVVDSSFMPTGLGLNPMITVVANALRVGTHIAEALRQGRTPGK